MLLGCFFLTTIFAKFNFFVVADKLLIKFYSSSESPSLEYPLFPLELLLSWLPPTQLPTLFTTLLLLELLALGLEPKEQLEMVGLERWWFRWTTLELEPGDPVDPALPLLEVLVLKGATELCLKRKQNNSQNSYLKKSRQNELSFALCCNFFLWFSKGKNLRYFSIMVQPLFGHLCNQERWFDNTLLSYH